MGLPGLARTTGDGPCTRDWPAWSHSNRSRVTDHDVVGIGAGGAGLLGNFLRERCARPVHASGPSRA